MKKCILFLMLLFSCMLSNAQIYWTANGNGISWSDPNNWDPIGVPQSFHIAVIDNDSVWATGGVEIRGLVLKNNAALTYQTTPIYEFVIDAPLRMAFSCKMKLGFT